MGSLSSHRHSPCSSYLQIPVNHPHLVAVQDGLQDLLDAVAVGERRKLTQVAGEVCFVRQFYSAAFHPFSPLLITASHQQPCSTAQHPPPPKPTHLRGAVLTQSEPNRAIGHQITVSRSLGDTAEPMGTPQEQHWRQGAGDQQWIHDTSKDLVPKPRQSRCALCNLCSSIISLLSSNTGGSAVSACFISSSLQPGSAVCVRQEGKKTEALIASAPKQLVCKAEGLYLHAFYFICMTLISGWAVSGCSAGSPLNEIVFCLEVKDISVQRGSVEFTTPLDIHVGYA